MAHLPHFFFDHFKASALQSQAEAALHRYDLATFEPVDERGSSARCRSCDGSVWIGCRGCYTVPCPIMGTQSAKNQHHSSSHTGNPRNGMLRVPMTDCCIMTHCTKRAPTGNQVQGFLAVCWLVRVLEQWVKNKSSIFRFFPIIFTPNRPHSLPHVAYYLFTAIGETPSGKQKSKRRLHYMNGRYSIPRP